MTSRDRSAGRGPGLLTLLAAGVATAVIADFMSAMERARPGKKEDEVVDLAGEGSFPASDPPPWTAGREPTEI